MYENNSTVAKSGWGIKDTITFRIPVTDTIQGYTIMINVRNDGAYAFNNLFLFVTMQAPTGLALKDTIECSLADESGKWTGSGWGSLWNSTFIFRENIRFPYTGIYTFKIIQAMRTEELLGITDVGVTVEQYSEKKRK